MRWQSGQLDFELPEEGGPTNCRYAPISTLVLDYAGGTYVSQVTAATEREALIQWTAKLSTEQITGYASGEG